MSKLATIQSKCPPLSEKDVLILRGRPALKATLLKDDELRRDRDSEHRSDRDSEWVYYSLATNTKQHYFFHGGHLTEYKETRI